METSSKTPEELEFESKLESVQKLAEELAEYDEFPAERVSFRQQLLSQEIEPREYAAWHAIIGSTVSFDDNRPFDIEGENSIIAHFEKLLAQLKSRI